MTLLFGLEKRRADRPARPASGQCRARRAARLPRWSARRSRSAPGSPASCMTGWPRTSGWPSCGPASWRRWRASRPSARRAVQDVRAAIDIGLGEARQAVVGLRSSGQADLSFCNVLRRTVQDYGDRFGLRVEFAFEGDRFGAHRAADPGRDPADRPGGDDQRRPARRRDDRGRPACDPSATGSRCGSSTTGAASTSRGAGRIRSASRPCANERRSSAAACGSHPGRGPGPASSSRHRSTRPAACRRARVELR